MIKRILLVVVAAGLLTAGCTSNDDNGGTTTTTADHSETTVTTSESSSSSGATQEFCDTKSKEIGSLFEQYAEALGDSSGGKAEIDAAVSTGRKLVELGRTFLNVCGHYYSSEKVNDLRIQLDDLEDNINSMARLNSSIYG